MIPEHFYDYQLIEMYIDMLQEEYEVVFTHDDSKEIYNLISLHFPSDDISLESIQAYFNTTIEEIDRCAHLTNIGLTY